MVSDGKGAVRVSGEQNGGGTGPWAPWRREDAVHPEMGGVQGCQRGDIWPCLETFLVATTGDAVGIYRATHRTALRAPLQ